MTNEHLTLTEALRYITEHYGDSVTRQTLYHWMGRGRKLPSGHLQVLPFRQCRCRRLISRADLDKFWQEELA